MSANLFSTLFPHGAETARDLAESAQEHHPLGWLIQPLDERVHHVDVAAVRASGMEDGCDEEADHAAVAQS